MIIVNDNIIILRLKQFVASVDQERTTAVIQLALSNGIDLRDIHELTAGTKERGFMAYVHPAVPGSLLLLECTVQSHGAVAFGSVMLSAQLSPWSTENAEHEGTSRHLAAHSVRLIPWHVMRLVWAPLAVLHQPVWIKNSGIASATHDDFVT